MKEEIRSDQFLAGLEGLKNLSAEIRSFSHTQPSYMIQPLLEFHYGCIETNGTGGAAFRTLYGRFLKINLENDNNQHIIRAAEDSEKSWNALADSYKNAAEDFKKSSKEKKIALLENIAKRAEDLYLAEKNFVDAINSHYKL
ncbi:MAG: DUF4872 domain-containing protein [Spirochaetaceae bacterium]|nr:DUF4872 domain-containing protein [Spirochaetaceae bacterium]